MSRLVNEDELPFVQGTEYVFSRDDVHELHARMRAAAVGAASAATSASVPLEFLYADESETSAGAFGSWAAWQREYMSRFFGERGASWAEGTFTSTQNIDPDPDPEPSQRVFTGDLPAYYIDAGATGNPVSITHAELLHEPDLDAVLQQFIDAAHVHAPWLELVSVENPFHGDPIQIRYQRPSITALPA